MSTHNTIFNINKKININYPESSATGFFSNGLKNEFETSHQYSMDGWMTCDFTPFSTVFQSYQDDVWMIIKGCVQWNLVYG